VDAKRRTAAHIQCLAEFRYQMRQFLHFSEEAAAAAGLTPQHHQFLLQIAGAPEGVLTTVGYLANRLALRHNSVVELTNRCEEAGLIERLENPENRRFVVLQLSCTGRKRLHSLSQAHARELHEKGPELIRLLRQLTKAEFEDMTSQ